MSTKYDRAGWYSGITLDSCSGGAWFEFCRGAGYSEALFPQADTGMLPR